MHGCVNTRYKRLERPPRASPPPQPRVSGFTGSWQLRSAPSALLLRRAGTGLPSQTTLEIPATRHPPPRQRLETLRGPLHRGRTLLVRREPGLGVSPGGRTRTAVPTAASHRAAGGLLPESWHRRRQPGRALGTRGSSPAAHVGDGHQVSQRHPVILCRFLRPPPSPFLFLPVMPL